MHTLADETGPHRILVLVLAFCGLRWGEAIALRVADVDFLRRRILVSANAVQLGITHHVGPTKDRRPRSVPVPGFVLEYLSRLCVGKAGGELVFPASSGGYLSRPHSGDGWFAAALRRAGLPAMTIHDLRHTCASLAVSAGVNVLALQRMLGHRSAKMTLDVYADLFDATSMPWRRILTPHTRPRMWARCGHKAPEPTQTSQLTSPPAAVIDRTRAARGGGGVNLRRNPVARESGRTTIDRLLYTLLADASAPLKRSALASVGPTD